jgi:MYXO-CTERM domain-containing protein
LATKPAASGGGGATSYWFLGLLALAGILRWKLRKTQALTSAGTILGNHQAR